MIFLEKLINQSDRKIQVSFRYMHNNLECKIDYIDSERGIYLYEKLYFDKIENNNFIESQINLHLIKLIDRVNLAIEYYD